MPRSCVLTHQLLLRVADGTTMNLWRTATWQISSLASSSTVTKLAGRDRARPVERGLIMLGGRNPVTERRRLLAELRRLRAAAGLTQKQVSTALEWSMSKVIRIEGGTVGISITDLKALLALYGVQDPEVVENLAGAARAAREKAWWDDYRPHVHPELIDFIAVEAAATSMAEYQNFVVPGILQ